MVIKVYRHLERSHVIQRGETPKNLLERSFCPCRHIIQMQRVEKSPNAEQYYPLQNTQPYCHSKRSEESPGKVVLPCKNN